MKLPIGLVGVIAIVWLGLWLGNTGVLVMSEATKIPKTRECSYFIGVTVVRKIEPLADRCPLMRTVSP